MNINAVTAETESESYTAPVLSELGTVTGATLGTAGNNNVDDTQYFE